MHLKEELETRSREETLEIAKTIAYEEKLEWSDGVGHVFKALLDNPTAAPFGIKTTKSNPSPPIQIWFQKYKKGLESRVSQKVSKPSKTIPDPVIDVMLGAAFPHLKKEQLKEIEFSHRLSMSAENLLGHLLEEYLALVLKPYGWFCAWGQTLRSIDFIHKTGTLLQIKNRSNSENSSSKAIREGTNIKKWYRIKSQKLEYMWDELNLTCKTQHLSENAFRSFIQKTMSLNPRCIAVDPKSCWLPINGSHQLTSSPVAN